MKACVAPGCRPEGHSLAALCSKQVIPPVIPLGGVPPKRMAALGPTAASRHAAKRPKVNWGDRLSRSCATHFQTPCLPPRSMCRRWLRCMMRLRRGRGYAAIWPPAGDWPSTNPVFSATIPNSTDSPEPLVDMGRDLGEILDEAVAFGRRVLSALDSQQIGRVDRDENRVAGGRGDQLAAVLHHAGAASQQR